MSLAVAISSNRWQMHEPQKRLKQAKPLPWVAPGCRSERMVRVHSLHEREGSPLWLRKKRQVLRTRRPTGLDQTTLPRQPAPSSMTRAAISTSAPTGSHRMRRRMSSGAKGEFALDLVPPLLEVLPALVVDRNGRARADEAAELDGVARGHRVPDWSGGWGSGRLPGAAGRC
jgi:hypothetical protein